MRTLLSLSSGEKAVISHIADTVVAGRLMSMGVIPGAVVQLVRKSLSGSTAIYRIRQMQLALRSDEAGHIILK